jgi:hypothetical protein
LQCDKPHIHVLEDLGNKAERKLNFSVFSHRTIVFGVEISIADNHNIEYYLLEKGYGLPKRRQVIVCVCQQRIKKGSVHDLTCLGWFLCIEIGRFSIIDEHQIT